MTSPPHTAVLAANRTFYEAFANGDAERMANVWAREHIVACIHPGRSPIHGRDAVLSTWNGILGTGDGPNIHVSDALATVVGEAAFVTCMEHVGDTNMAATNVFVLERGEWRLVHHHAGPVAVRAPSRRPSLSRLN